MGQSVPWSFVGFRSAGCMSTNSTGAVLPRGLGYPVERLLWRTIKETVSGHPRQWGEPLLADPRNGFSGLTDNRSRSIPGRSAQAHGKWVNYFKAIRSDPPAINAAPTYSRAVSFSPRNSAANASANTTLSLSTGATCETLPNWSALK